MKSLFYGIGVVTLAGLAIGGALRPSLAMDRIGGPQITIGDSGRQAYGDAEYQAVSNAYPYGVPDYVTGTDHIDQPGDEIYGPEYGYQDAAWREAASDLPIAEPAGYNAVTLPTYDSEVRYPSLGGGILAGIDRTPVDLGPEVFEPADAPAREMAAFEADHSGPIPYDQAFQTQQ